MALSGQNSPAGMNHSSSSSSSSSNTNSKSSSGADKNSNSSSSGGFGGQNSPAGKSSSGGGTSSNSGGNNNSKGNSAGADRNGGGSGGGGFGGGNSPAGMNNGGLGGGGGGLNSASNRSSGAGPGASSNTSTTGGGYGGSTVGGGIGGMGSPRGMNSSLGSSPSTGMNSPRGMSNPSLTGDDKARQGALAQQARQSENQSMKDLAREQALGTISKAEAGIKDPYNTLSGGLVGNVTNMTVREAVDFAKTAWTGKLANVVGAFQMKDTTLAAVAAKMGLLDAKMTPQIQDRLAVGLLQERANRATINGKVDVDTFAKELAKEWASMATPTGLSHYAKNGIDKASVSYATVHEIAKDLVANGVVSAGRSVSSITSKDASSVATQTPGVSSFSSKYMGGATTSTPQKSASTQNDPSGLAPGTYRGYDPSGLPADKPASAPPTPTARPSDPTAVVSGPPTATPPVGDFPSRPRSLGEKIAAGAIDIGGGMLPGIGMGISVINGGLALTGNSTLGEHIVDSFATGKGAGVGPNSGANRAGGSGKDQTVKDTSTVPKSESFEDKYMKFVDPTVRPTPGQRWDYNTPGYA